MTLTNLPAVNFRFINKTVNGIFGGYELAAEETFVAEVSHQWVLLANPEDLLSDFDCMTDGFWLRN